MELEREEFKGNILVTISASEVRLWVCNEEGQNIFRFKALGKVFKAGKDITVLPGVEPIIIEDDNLLYAIGTEHRSNEFGMWHGPTPVEQEMLEVDGKTNKDCILQLSKDEEDNTITDVIWRWQDDQWIANAKI